MKSYFVSSVPYFGSDRFALEKTIDFDQHKDCGCAKLEVATVMGPTTATVAEPVLFLQPTSAGAQERETNGSWASAGAFCAGAAVAAGAISLAAAQTKSAVQTPSRREQRAALRAARHAALEMTADASTAVLILSPSSVMVA